MLDEQTDWPRLYAIAALLGGGLGLLLSLDLLPSAPDWPALVTIAGGALTGLVLAGASHIGVRLQLRRRSRGSPLGGGAWHYGRRQPPNWPIESTIPMSRSSSARCIRRSRRGSWP